MRMRRKKGLVPRLQKVSHLSIKNPADFQGNWRASFLPDAAGLHVELGCGKGGFVTAMAEAHKDILFVAVEKVANVALAALENTDRLRLDNVKFILADAALLPQIFSEGEVDVFYLNFSDPWPDQKHAYRRLTHREFLKIYQKIIRPEGRIEFKTDHHPLFQFSVGEFRENGWYLEEVTENLPETPENIETEYERRFRDMGVPICRFVAYLEKRQ